MFMKWNTLNRNIIYNKQRVMSFIILGLKTTSWVGTIWSGLKANFHLLAQSFILAKSVLIWELHCVTLLTVENKENKDVSPLKSFEFEFKFLVRSLTYNRNNRGPRTDRWWMPPLITLCSLLVGKSFKRDCKSSEKPYYRYSLCAKP